jgi:ubiquinone/menaquinone biosynthesis C-methylase UbiE
MNLLPKEALISTSAVDHADWNYSPVLAYVMRRRFALIRALLPREHMGRLLEIGFGSGVFMPELSTRCGELYGIDIHPFVEQVEETLRERGTHATLSRQSAAQLHFPNGYFDAIVSVSALEFIDDIGAAAREAARVLTAEGRLIFVMPAHSRLLDAALRTLTGADPQKDYGNRREGVLPALLEHFRIERKATFAGVYMAYSLQRASQL